MSEWWYADEPITEEWRIGPDGFLEHRKLGEAEWKPRSPSLKTRIAVSRLLDSMGIKH